MKENYQINDIVFYKGDNMRPAECSNEGYTIITNVEIIDNWIEIKFLDSENSFGCPIEKITTLNTKKMYLENFGFQSKKIDNYITGYKLHIFNHGDIQIYHSPSFGFCSTENIDTLKFIGQFDVISFFKKNKNLNNINHLIDFLIKSKVSGTRKEIFKRMLNYYDSI